MDKRLIELAIEALEARKVAIGTEIAELKGGKSEFVAPAPAVAGIRGKRTAAQGAIRADEGGLGGKKSQGDETGARQGEGNAAKPIPIGEDESVLGIPEGTKGEKIVRAEGL
jgi:hypothetical protein